MWQLGYGDDMDPDRCSDSDFETPNGLYDLGESNTDYDSDDTYTTETSSNADVNDEIYSVSDDAGSVVSVSFLPCTPHNMSMNECWARNLLQRRCVQSSQ
jgi:hypothetical protein